MDRAVLPWPLYAMSMCLLRIIRQNDNCERQCPQNTLWPQIFRPLMEDMLWRSPAGDSMSCSCGWREHCQSRCCRRGM